MSSQDVFFSHGQYENSEQYVQNINGYIIGEKDGKLMRVAKSGLPLFTFSFDRELRENYTIIPNLLTHPGSVLSFTSGESVVRETLSLRRDVLRQKTFLFDPYHVTDFPSASINLLDTLDSKARNFYGDARSMAECLVQQFSDASHLAQKEYNRENPTTLSYEPTLRPGMAADLLTAMFIYLKASDEVDAPLENRNLVYCAEILNSDKDKWNGLMVGMRRFGEEKHHSLLEASGRHYFISDDNDYFVKAKQVAAMALSFASDPEMAAHLKTSSFDVSDLRKDKISVYIVMPQNLIEDKAPWLRLLVNRAQDLCPNVIDSDDRHKTLPQEERIMFMLDSFNLIGRLNAFSHGLSTSPLLKGITYWGLAQFETSILETYGNRHFPTGNNAYVQKLDEGFTHHNYGRGMLELVKHDIIASPPRPYFDPSTTPYYRQRELRQK